MSEAKARKKLEEIAVRWNGKVSADQILHAFKNLNSKYSNEKLIGIAKQHLRNHIVDGDKLITQLEVNVKKNQKTPHEALILMLNNATLTQSPNIQQQQSPQQILKPTIQPKPSNLQVEPKLSAKNDFESPALCSTRLENNIPEIDVSEVSSLYWFFLKYATN